jgi:hypothetical protein
LFLLCFCVLPLPFWLSSPKGICRCPCSPSPATTARHPIHRALCESGSPLSLLMG